MTYTREGTNLVITCTPEEQAALKELPDRSCVSEADALDGLTSNSELQWIHPVNTGDLTDAPMLGVLGLETYKDNLPPERYGEIEVGRDKGGAYYQPILERWAYMSYAIRSFIDVLIEEGKVTFVSQN